MTSHKHSNSHSLVLYTQPTGAQETEKHMLSSTCARGKNGVSSINGLSVSHNKK